MKIRVRIDLITEMEVEGSEYHVIADTGNKYDDGAMYGYVPTGTKIERTETKIFEQAAEVLSIQHIIAAINNLEVKR